MKKSLTSNYIKVVIVVISIMLLLFILTLCLFYFKPYIAKMKSGYIPTYKRNNYVILNADNILLNDYISKKANTLLVFFATWCPSCVEESNDLNEFITKHPDIPVIVVSHDKNLEKIEDYLKENNYNWFVILDTERKLRESIDSDTKGIPSSYLLDKNLTVLSKEIMQMTENDFDDFYNLNLNK